MAKPGTWKYISMAMAVLLILGLITGSLPLGLVRADTVVTFPDANLEAAIRDALGKPSGDIYASELAGLTNLGANNRGIINLAGLEYCTNLSQLNLYNNRISDLTAISGLIGLVWLNLEYNQISELAPLSSLDNLRELYLYNNELNDLTPLGGLINLTNLGLGNNQISNLTPLAGLINLTWLSIGSNQISDLTALNGLINLTALGLGSNQISDLTPLMGLVNLIELGLDSNQINDLTPLSGMTNLQRLYLTSNQINNLTPLTGLIGLTNLYMTNNQINNLTSLSGMTNLQWLTLDNNQIIDITKLAGLTSLTNLSLYNNQISDLTPLAGLINLQNLNVDNNQIINITALAGLTNLTALLLDGNQISDLTPLAGLTNLTGLYLESNQISNPTPLAGLTSLQSLGLGSNQISNLTALAGLTKLTGLSLYNNQISDLSPMLGLTNLNWLVLSNNQINDLTPLVDNTGLSVGDTVFLYGNPLNQTSAKVQIPVLQARGVTVYWDGDFVVTFPDANLEAAIRQALNQPTGDIYSNELAFLTSLDASNRGIINLDGLEYCTRITELRLEDNQISDISPLVDNSGLASGDTVWLTNNPLSQNSINVDIPTLQARGVTVVWDDPIIVTFPDANLEAAIRETLNKPTGDIHSSELAGLKHLYADTKGIVNLTGLEYCINITDLELQNNQISDLTPLTGLVSLQDLNLDYNQISNLTPLAGLVNIQRLYLDFNQITNLSPLAGMTKIAKIMLDNNQISDIKPLVDNWGLAFGDVVYLENNPLSQISINTYIPALQARGVQVIWEGSSPPPEPVSPGTTQWHKLNTPAIGNEIISPSEVNKLAVAADGATIWAVDTPANTIRKSVRMGCSWSEAPNSALHSAMTAAGIPQQNQSVWDVVLAPDNPNLVAVVTGSDNSTSPTDVWLSTDGGAAWECKYFSSVSGGALIGAISVSKGYGTNRDIAVGARDGVPGAFRLWVLQTSSSNGWILQGNKPIDNADIMALEFSPRYNEDGCLAVVFCTDNATYYNIANREIITHSAIGWVFSLSFPGIEVKDPTVLPGASPEATTIVNADIELPSDFIGVHAVLRRAYISLNSLGYPTKAATARDGIFRIDDSTVYTLMDTSQQIDKSISSIAYFGNYASGKLLAGEVMGYPCTATVPTWFTDSPTECPIPCWYPALKPATGAAAQGNCAIWPQKSNGNAEVAWSPDGKLAYCGTSSADFRRGGVNTTPGSGCWPGALKTGVALDESAFSLTRNNGETWNQIGLIDTRIDKLSDVAASGDSSTIYLASINNNDATGSNCAGFDSVWRSSSNWDVTSPLPAQAMGTFWERVFTHSTSPECTDNQTNMAMLRLVPRDDDPTGEIVAWGVYDPNGSLAHGVAAWSPDYGDYWAMITPRIPLQDFCFESRTVLYFLSPSGLVQKMPYTGTAWSSTIPNVNTGIGSAYSIAAAPEGNVLVGGGVSSIYPVAYSHDGAESFAGIPGPLRPGTVLATFAANFNANGVIYAATNSSSGGTIYRNTVPTFGPWTDLKPLQLGYSGLATGPHWSLYAANPMFVERALDPEVGVPGDSGEWDVLISNLWNFNVRVGLPPNSLKSSGRSEQAATLYFIDDRPYDTGAGRGQLWLYSDCQEVNGPDIIETTTAECVAATGKPSRINCMWNRGCWESFYEFQIADTDNFTAGGYTFPWHRPVNSDSPNFAIPQGGLLATSVNAPSWVGTLSDSVSNVLGILPSMASIGLAPAMSVPAFQPLCNHVYYWRVRSIGSPEGDIIRSPWSATGSFTALPKPVNSASVLSATGTGLVTFSTDIGSIIDLVAVAEETLPAVGKPMGASFPHGLFSFKITGISPGATATITITFPSTLPDQTQYWKYQEGRGWYQIPIVSHVDNVVVVRVTDGGLGDNDGFANGTIVDPSGTAVYSGTTVPGGPTAGEGQSVPRRVSPSLPKSPQLPPPDVRLNNISVYPAQTQAGQPVTIAANLVNNGGSGGSYNVILRINDKVEQQRTVQVSPGTAYPVKFTVTRFQPGAYMVNINGQKGNFVILSADSLQRNTVGQAPLLVAMLTIILLLVCLVVLLARRRLQGY
jgi:internalin A